MALLIIVLSKFLTNAARRWWYLMNRHQLWIRKWSGEVRTLCRVTDKLEKADNGGCNQQKWGFYKKRSSCWPKSLLRAADQTIVEQEHHENVTDNPKKKTQNFLAKFCRIFLTKSWNCRTKSLSGRYHTTSVWWVNWKGFLWKNMFADGYRADQRARFCKITACSQTKENSKWYGIQRGGEEVVGAGSIQEQACLCVS